MHLFRKHPIYALIGVVGLLFASLLVSAAEAPAAPQAATGGPVLPVWVGSPQVCVNDHTQGSGIPFYTSAVRWDDNAAITVRHESQVGGDCTAAGYPLGRQLEVFLVDSALEGCVHYYVASTTGADGKQYRTRTIAYLHANELSCWSTATRKANRASKTIGGFLGAKQFANTTVSVMGSDISINDTVPYPIPYDLDTINDHYWWWRKA